MGIRQTLNEKPALGMTLTGVLIVAALGAIFWQVRAAQPSRHGSRQLFYTDDDGATYFADSADKITPFTDADGKPAVQAMVYQCADGKPFVGYLVRLTEEGRRTAQKALQQTGSTRVHLGPEESEVKKPGSRNWIRFDSNNPQPYTNAMAPKCPDGATTGLRVVQPQP